MSIVNLLEVPTTLSAELSKTAEMTQQGFNFQKALQDPKSAYGTPERVLADPRLDREGKRAILESWERNERKMMLAEREGAASEKRPMLRRVLNALSTISMRDLQITNAPKKGSNRGRVSPRSSSGRPIRPLIEDIMRPINEVVHVDQDLHDAGVRMRHFRLPFLPVVDGDEIVGLLTARDIFGRGLMSIENVKSGKIRDHMSTDFAYCYETDDLEMAKATMADGHHRHLLVVDIEKHLAGLVTEEQLSAALREHGLGAKFPARERIEERFVRTPGRAKETKRGKPKVYAVKPKVKR